MNGEFRERNNSINNQNNQSRHAGCDKAALSKSYKKKNRRKRFSSWAI